MAKAGPGDITRLIDAWRSGKEGAFEELAPLVYRELRGLAAAYLRRERPNHTLQATALVHEAYLRLVDQARLDSHSQAHFFAISANLMRQILVDHARARRAAKRGGGNKVSVHDSAAAVPPLDLDLLSLDVALEKLARLDPRQTQIVEMRFFAGFTEDEIARVLDIAPITVKRQWAIAKAFLYRELAASIADV
jgi:RNA polymerase sigma factor (TIGR02999 family)